jgi:hypothetical protein
VILFRTEMDFQRADWRLLQNGAVNLFRRPEVIAQAQVSLEGLGYRISQVNCRDGQPVFREQMSEALSWREQFCYGLWTGSIDALNDGFSLCSFGENGRAAFVFQGFHRIAAEDAQWAHAVLDAFECSARSHLLSGNFLIGLVQTDDERFCCPPLGGRSPSWNDKEWLHTKHSPAS